MAVVTGSPAPSPAPAGEVVTPPKPRRKVLGQVGLYAALLLLAALFFVPFLWSVSTSFKTLPDSLTFSLWPRNPTLRGYRDALTTFNFAKHRRPEHYRMIVDRTGALPPP